MPRRDLRLLTLADGRVVDVDDTGDPPGASRTVVWFRGSPHTGALFEPLLGLARASGVRLVSVARPAYGRSTPRPGRSVADAAADVLEVADRLGIGTFGAMGESGGGPHALASAALAPDRVRAVAVFASVAPYTDVAAWWDGMVDPGGLRAALAGREARLRHAETAEWDPGIFVDTDHAALAGDWAALGHDAAASGPAGEIGLADDDVAFVRPWGVELSEVVAPVLLVQGRRDRVVPPAHAELLAAVLPTATLRWEPDAGHVAVLGAVPRAWTEVVRHLP